MVFPVALFMVAVTLVIKKKIYIKDTIFIYIQFDCVRLRKTNIRFSRVGPSF